MSRTRFEIKRVLFVNGVRLRLTPTMGMLDEIEAAHESGEPWGDCWVEGFTVRTVVDEVRVYARYDVKLVSRRTLIG